jgi:FKBP-type peptidyl-prolyl cis-trans isomerase (trigger factor)
VREQVLNQLISRTLISQAAEASGTAVPAAQIDAQIESVTGQFESEEAYLAELDAQGLTEAELRSQIEAELLGQIYLEGTLDYESIAVTEEEVQSTYEQVAASGGQVPPLAEVREQVEQLVIQQKQQTLVAAHVDELRAEADIETFI